MEIVVNYNRLGERSDYYGENGQTNVGMVRRVKAV